MSICVVISRPPCWAFKASSDLRVWDVVGRLAAWTITSIGPDPKERTTTEAV